MTTERGYRNLGRRTPVFKLEAEQCSACGRSSPNEDYALFDCSVGMCVADGIGGAPLGDAVARYACHVAMGIMREGGTARDAVIGAGEQVRNFVTTVDSPCSGASIIVARIDGDALDASWAGNAALFVLEGESDFPSVTSTLERRPLGSEMPLCGGPKVRPGSLTKALADGEMLLLCTDGAWRRTNRESIGRILLGSGSLREAAARLVLGQQPEDDATAIVARVHTSSRDARVRGKDE